MNKADIRKSIKEQKKLLTDDDKATAAELAFAKLEQTPQFVNANNILMYHSLPDEISTHAFIDKWCECKHIFLPRVNGDDLDILAYNKDAMHQGSFNIEEPDGDALCKLSDIDLIIVPGVAFDAKCNRVGRGKGYYDRLLTESSAPKIGMAYDLQIVEQIDIEPHDIPVDMVITDKHSFSR
jgi:5-formyltetrahydrofolate cyclo-ligase